MFNENFFPTPVNVIEKMIEGLLFNGYKSILEPSAGKGDILDYLVSKKNIPTNKVYCIELEPELQSILRDKSYKIIDSNFLNHGFDRSYDLILMNPPFDSGASHLLKAIEISEGQGTQIRCLLNSETLNNPYSRERQLLMRKLELCEAEIVDLGQCFKNAERQSDVNVSLVKIFLPYKDTKFSFKYNSDIEKEKYNLKEFTANELADTNLAIALVDSYEKTKKVFEEFLIKWDELKYYVKSCSTVYDSQIIDVIKNQSSLNYVNGQFIKLLRAGAWENVFTNTPVMNKVTNKIQKDLSDLKTEQKEIAFNVENIQSLISALSQNYKKIQLDCIVDTFDLLTAYHEENRVHIEGWKTNLFWKVSKRFILPRVFDTWKYNNYSSTTIDYGFKDKITDVEKALCFLKGIEYTSINSFRKVFDGKYLNFDEKYETEFFKIKFYKKATAHFEFKDLKLLQEFNYYASLHRNWLGSMSNYDKEKMSENEINQYSKDEIDFKERIKNNPLLLAA